MSSYRTIRIESDVADAIDVRKEEILRRTGRKPSHTTMIKEMLSVLKSEQQSVCPYCKSMTYGGCSHLIFLPKNCVPNTEQILTEDEIQWLTWYRKAQRGKESWVHDIIRSQRTTIRTLSEYVAGEE